MKIEKISEDEVAATFNVNTMVSENPKVNAAVCILTLVDSLSDAVEALQPATPEAMKENNGMAVIHALHIAGFSLDELLEASQSVDKIRREMKEQTYGQ